MSITIAISNSKGGAGKSTSAVNLGAALSAFGKKVLEIDNDVQGNLTAALGYTQGEHKNTLATDGQRSCCVGLLYYPRVMRRLLLCASFPRTLRSLSIVSEKYSHNNHLKPQSLASVFRTKSSVVKSNHGSIL